MAQENYQGSATILKGIEDEILAARLNIKNDSINFFRQKNLWDQHIGSRLEFESKKLRYELASNNLKSLKSKINGKIYALYKDPGEIVNTIEPLASIGSATNFIIELLVDEVDIVRISKNQKVLINLDAYKGSVFKGTISKIYPKKN